MYIFSDVMCYVVNDLAFETILSNDRKTLFCVGKEILYIFNKSPIFDESFVFALHWLKLYLLLTRIVKGGRYLI